MTNAVAPARECDVSLADGRRLHVHEAGDPDGSPVVVHHGTPGAGILPATWHDAAVSDRVRLVSFDRAGYGGSDRNPGRAVRDVAPDTAVVADALGIDAFRTFGVSGGGPHVLACAALLGDRVIAAVCMSGIAPYDAAGLDFLAGMGQDNIDEFGVTLAGEESLEGYLSEQRTAVLGMSPQDLASGMESLLPPVDKAALSGDFADFMHASFSQGLSRDCAGWVDDDLAFVKRWGFDLSDIAVPTLVVGGGADLFVPFAHAEWLAAHVPGATADLSPNEGHLSLFAQFGRSQRWLLDQGVSG